jgi:hypothetical protein
LTRTAAALEDEDVDGAAVAGAAGFDGVSTGFEEAQPPTIAAKSNARTPPKI